VAIDPNFLAAYQRSQQYYAPPPPVPVARPTYAAPPGMPAPPQGVTVSPVQQYMARQQAAFNRPMAPSGGGGVNPFTAIRPAGQQPAAQEEGGGFLGVVLGNPFTKTLLQAANVLDVPRRLVQSGLKEAYDILPGGDEASFNEFAAQAADRSFSLGKNIPEMPGPINEILGFGVDVATDPLTYVLPGSSAFLGSAGKMALAEKAIARGIGTEDVLGRIAKLGEGALTAAERETMGIGAAGLRWGTPTRNFRLPGTGALQRGLLRTTGAIRAPFTGTAIGRTARRWGASRAEELRPFAERFLTGQGEGTLREAASGYAARNALFAGEQEFNLRFRNRVLQELKDLGGKPEVTHTLENQAIPNTPEADLLDTFFHDVGTAAQKEGVTALEMRKGYVTHRNKPVFQNFLEKATGEDAKLLVDAPGMATGRVKARKFEPGKTYKINGEEITFAADHPPTIQDITTKFQEKFPQLQGEQLLEDDPLELAAAYLQDMGRDVGRARLEQTLIDQGMIAPQTREMVPDKAAGKALADRLTATLKPLQERRGLIANEMGGGLLAGHEEVLAQAEGVAARATERLGELDQARAVLEQQGRQAAGETYGAINVTRDQMDVLKTELQRMDERIAMMRQSVHGGGEFEGPLTRQAIANAEARRAELRKVIDTERMSIRERDRILEALDESRAQLKATQEFDVGIEPRFGEAPVAVPEQAPTRIFAAGPAGTPEGARPLPRSVPEAFAARRERAMQDAYDELLDAANRGELTMRHIDQLRATARPLTDEDERVLAQVASQIAGREVQPISQAKATAAQFAGRPETREALARSAIAEEAETGQSKFSKILDDEGNVVGTDVRMPYGANERAAAKRELTPDQLTRPDVLDPAVIDNAPDPVRELWTRRQAELDEMLRPHRGEGPRGPSAEEMAADNLRRQELEQELDAIRGQMNREERRAAGRTTAAPVRERVEEVPGELTPTQARMNKVLARRREELQRRLDAAQKRLNADTAARTERVNPRQLLNDRQRRRYITLTRELRDELSTIPEPYVAAPTRRTVERAGRRMTAAVRTPEYRALERRFNTIRDELTRHAKQVQPRLNAHEVTPRASMDAVMKANPLIARKAEDVADLAEFMARWHRAVGQGVPPTEDLMRAVADKVLSGRELTLADRSSALQHALGRYKYVAESRGAVRRAHTAEEIEDLLERDWQSYRTERWPTPGRKAEPVPERGVPQQAAQARPQPQAPTKPSMGRAKAWKRKNPKSKLTAEQVLEQMEADYPAARARFEDEFKAWQREQTERGARIAERPGEVPMVERRQARVWQAKEIKPPPKPTRPKMADVRARAEADQLTIPDARKVLNREHRAALKQWQTKAERAAKLNRTIRAQEAAERRAREAAVPPSRRKAAEPRMTKAQFFAANRPKYEKQRVGIISKAEKAAEAESLREADTAMAGEFSEIVSRIMEHVRTARKGKNQFDAAAREAGLLPKQWQLDRLATPEEREVLTAANNLVQLKDEGGKFIPYTDTQLELKRAADEVRTNIQLRMQPVDDAGRAEVRRKFLDSWEIADDDYAVSNVRTMSGIERRQVDEYEREAMNTLKQFVGADFDTPRKAVSQVAGGAKTKLMMGNEDMTIPQLRDFIVDTGVARERVMDTESPDKLLRILADEMLDTPGPPIRTRRVRNKETGQMEEVTEGQRTWLEATNKEINEALGLEREGFPIRRQKIHQLSPAELVDARLNGMADDMHNFIDTERADSLLSLYGKMTPEAKARLAEHMGRNAHEVNRKLTDVRLRRAAVDAQGGGRNTLKDPLEMLFGNRNEGLLGRPADQTVKEIEGFNGLLDGKSNEMWEHLTAAYDARQEQLNQMMSEIEQLPDTLVREGGFGVGPTPPGQLGFGQANTYKERMFQQLAQQQWELWRDRAALAEAFPQVRERFAQAFGMQPPTGTPRDLSDIAGDRLRRVAEEDLGFTEQAQQQLMREAQLAEEREFLGVERAVGEPKVRGVGRKKGRVISRGEVGAQARMTRAVEGLEHPTAAFAPETDAQAEFLMTLRQSQRDEAQARIDRLEQALGDLPEDSEAAIAQAQRDMRRAQYTPKNAQIPNGVREELERMLGPDGAGMGYSSPETVAAARQAAQDDYDRLEQRLAELPADMQRQLDFITKQHELLDTTEEQALKDAVEADRLVERAKANVGTVKGAKLGDKTTFDVFDAATREVRDAIDAGADPATIGQLAEVAKRLPELEYVDKMVMNRREIAKRAKNGELTQMAKDVIAPGMEAFQSSVRKGQAPEQISSYVDRTMTNIEKILLDRKTNGLGKAVDAYTQFFKAYATATPGFHLRNALSAAFMNASDGVSVRNMIGGARIWSKFEKQGYESLDDLEKQVVRAVAGSGVGGPFSISEIGRAASGVPGGRATQNWFTKGSRRIGERVEGAARAGAALDTLMGGGELGKVRRVGDVSEATARINRLHFNYSQVSSMDEKMRRVVPFWTFLSRNLPLQIQQMWTRPRAYAMFNSLKRNVGMTEEEGGVGMGLPQYMREAGAFQILPGMALMPDIGPTQAAQTMAMVQRPTKLLSQLNPAWKVPAQMIAGKNFFYDRPYDELEFQRMPADISWLGSIFDAIGATEQAPGGGEVVQRKWADAARELIPQLSQWNRLFGTTPEREDLTTQAWANWMGIPIKELTPDVLAREQRRQVWDPFFERQEEQERKEAVLEALRG
jgi:hypothetical protein